MTSDLQPDLFSQGQVLNGTVTLSELAAFRAFLRERAAWQTRRQLSEGLGWPERKLREVAEAMGAEVVRCQSGFKLAEQCSREDLPAIQQAIDASKSQAGKMLRYALALERRLHGMISA